MYTLLHLVLLTNILTDVKKSVIFILESFEQSFDLDIHIFVFEILKDQIFCPWPWINIQSLALTLVLKLKVVGIGIGLEAQVLGLETQVLGLGLESQVLVNITAFH